MASVWTPSPYWTGPCDGLTLSAIDCGHCNRFIEPAKAGGSKAGRHTGREGMAAPCP